MPLRISPRNHQQTLFYNGLNYVIYFLIPAVDPPSYSLNRSSSHPGGSQLHLPRENYFNISSAILFFPHLYTILSRFSYYVLLNKLPSCLCSSHPGGDLHNDFNMQFLCLTIFQHTEKRQRIP